MSEETAADIAAADGRDFVTEADVAQTEAPSRPEWLPEKYNTGEDLAKAYKELESKLGSREADIRSKILEEIQSEAYKDRPESSGDYQLPDLIDESMAVDNELLQWWSEHSFENGYSQEEFEQGIAMYAKAIQANQPDLEAEAKKLGDNASARIDAAALFANKFFPKEAMPAIERMCETHEGILALEAIQEAMKGAGFSEPTTAPNQITEASLKEMMRDERYWNRSDPEYVRQVDEGFRKLYARG